MNPWLIALVIGASAVLSTLVVPVEFGTETIELFAVLEPVSVKVLLPAPVAVKVEEKTSGPEPLASSVTPPVVPAMLITRLVVLPEPT